MNRWRKTTQHLAFKAWRKKVFGSFLSKFDFHEMLFSNIAALTMSLLLAFPFCPKIFGFVLLPTPISGIGTETASLLLLTFLMPPLINWTLRLSAATTVSLTRLPCLRREESFAGVELFVVPKDWVCIRRCCCCCCDKSCWFWVVAIVDAVTAACKAEFNKLSDSFCDRE